MFNITLCINRLLNITEIPATINKPLTDQNVKSEGILTMECEVANPNVQVCWQKDGQDIISDRRIQITSDHCTHKLKIADVTMDDGGTYTCVCGEEKTECNITVEGKLFIIPSCMIPGYQLG